LLAGAGLFVASWLVFDIATDAIPLLVVSLGLIVYVLYQQGAIKGSSLAVTPRSFPEVDALARSAAVRLGTNNSDLFIKQSYELNAFALGILTGRPHRLHFRPVTSLTLLGDVSGIDNLESCWVRCGFHNL
jgi:hypothetical protein